VGPAVAKPIDTGLLFGRHKLESQTLFPCSVQSKLLQQLEPDRRTLLPLPYSFIFGVNTAPTARIFSSHLTRIYDFHTQRAGSGPRLTLA